MKTTYVKWLELIRRIRWHTEYNYVIIFTIELEFRRGLGGDKRLWYNLSYTEFNV